MRTDDDARTRQRVDAPMSIYEVHLGSWQRAPEIPVVCSPLRLRPAGEYAQSMGFTRRDPPGDEHPLCPVANRRRRLRADQPLRAARGLHSSSMSCTSTGSAASSTDPVAPSDEHGLAYFDGTHLYEHDPRQLHPDWGSLIFNYGRNEVRSFALQRCSGWSATMRTACA
jgi:1,4-alpha-glucan branching enzyme